MPQPLSYAITSLASDDILAKFHTAKVHFDLLYTQQKTNPEHYILKNLAHITLKRLFYLNEGIRDEEVRSALTSIQFSPIPIEATRLEVFETEKFGNVLVVLVEKSPALQKLHEDLRALIDPVTTNPDHPFEGDAFNAHLSILYNLPENRIEETKKYAEEHLLPIQYTLNSFLFMRDVAGVVGERELIKEYPAR